MRAHFHKLVRTGDERGAALVEFALVLPILMMLLLGIVTGGSAYQKKITIVDAVREGARYGATLEVGTETSPYPVWVDLVRNRVADLSGGILKVSDVCVDLDDPGGSASPCGVADPATPGTERLVKVTATKDARLEAFFFSRELNLRGQSVARYEREPS